MEQGKIQLYTGDGKGKSTAALGLAIRATGQGFKVAMIYFDKGGDDYGERTVLKQLNITYFITGLDRRNKDSSFRFGVTDEDCIEGARGLKIVEKCFSEGYDLVICDEINTATKLGIIALSDAVELIKKRPDGCELVLTGRYAPQELIDLADLVTEMKPIKHYFNQGLDARRGIEY